MGKKEGQTRRTDLVEESHKPRDGVEKLLIRFMMVVEPESRRIGAVTDGAGHEDLNLRRDVGERLLTRRKVSMASRAKWEKRELTAPKRSQMPLCRSPRIGSSSTCFVSASTMTPRRRAQSLASRRGNLQSSSSCLRSGRLACWRGRLSEFYEVRCGDKTHV